MPPPWPTEPAEVTIGLCARKALVTSPAGIPGIPALVSACVWGRFPKPQMNRAEHSQASPAAAAAATAPIAVPASASPPTPVTGTFAVVSVTPTNTAAHDAGSQQE